MQSYDHIQLLQRLHNGELGAFEQVYQAYRAWLVVTAITILEDEVLSEEVVNDFFVKAWQKQSFTQVPRFRNAEALKGYLYTCVKNICLTKLKRESVRKRRLQEIMVPPGHVVPPNMLENQDLAIHISRALDHLSPREHLSFVLAYMHHKSRKEIAAELSISENTVKVQLGIAVKKMREILKKVKNI
ncbi:RNA polymerase sigma factor [Chitinophaga skermanii]|nr:sigma-70 family RNA polymerase sigma factor [Chitinophaga skermanii]